jgi:hypothetical protein
VSDTDIKEGLSIEVFLLAREKTDMAAYEYGEGGQPPAG